MHAVVLCSMWHPHTRSSLYSLTSCYFVICPPPPPQNLQGEEVLLLWTFCSFSLEPARFLPLDLIQHQNSASQVRNAYLECLLATCLSLSRDPWDFWVFRSLQRPWTCAFKVLLALGPSESVVPVYTVLHITVYAVIKHALHISLYVAIIYIPFLLWSTTSQRILSSFAFPFIMYLSLSVVTIIILIIIALGSMMNVYSMYQGFL